MTRSSRRSLRRSTEYQPLRTWILIISGFIMFYFGSQVFTAEDAHLSHWGLALVGGLAGWLVGAVIDRLRDEGK